MLLESTLLADYCINLPYGIVKQLNYYGKEFFQDYKENF